MTGSCTQEAVAQTCSGGKSKKKNKNEANEIFGGMVYP